MTAVDYLQLCIEFVTLVATTILTIVVYKFTKVAAVSNAVQSINEGWATYNTTMVQKNNIDLFNKFLASDDVYDGTERQYHFILYLLLNNLSNQHYAAKSNVLDPEFSRHSSQDYFSWLFPKREYVVKLMQERGYDDELVAFVSNGFDKIERDKLETSKKSIESS